MIAVKGLSMASLSKKSEEYLCIPHSFHFTMSLFLFLISCVFRHLTGRPVFAPDRSPPVSLYLRAFNSSQQPSAQQLCPPLWPIISRFSTNPPSCQGNKQPAGYGYLHLRVKYVLDITSNPSCENHPADLALQLPLHPNLPR